jgi:hypothetical protein
MFERPQTVPLGIQEKDRLDIRAFEQLNGTGCGGALELLCLSLCAMGDLIAHGPHFYMVAQPRQQRPIPPPSSP